VCESQVQSPFSKDQTADDGGVKLKFGLNKTCGRGRSKWEPKMVKEARDVHESSWPTWDLIGEGSNFGPSPSPTKSQDIGHDRS
jgi:hypothetical protein